MRQVDSKKIYLLTRLANIPGLWKLAGTSRTAGLINTAAPLLALLQLQSASLPLGTCSSNSSCSTALIPASLPDVFQLSSEQISCRIKAS